MPRILNDAVYKQTILAAISGIVPGPFAYAEKYEETSDNYVGLIIYSGLGAQIGITTPDSVIFEKKVAEQKNNKPKDQSLKTFPPLKMK